MTGSTWKVTAVLVAILMLLGVGAGIAMAQDSTTQPSEAGLVIVAVEAGGPAANAGVVRGDILLEFDGAAVNTLEELLSQYDTVEAGDDVRLLVLHGDEKRTLRATLGDRDGEPYLGITPYVAQSSRLPLIDRLADQAARVQAGALVVEVVPDSAAEAAGLAAGDVIVTVDGQAFEDASLAEVLANYAPDDQVMLEIRRAGEEELVEAEVTLGENPDQEDKAFLGVSFRMIPDMAGMMEMFDLDQLPFRQGPGGTYRFQMPDDEEGMMPFHQWFQMPDDEDGMMPFHQWFQMPDGEEDMMPFHRWFQAPDGEAIEGVLVRSVADDSPASAAGLQAGDIIAAVDGTAVNSPQAIVDLLADLAPGDSVTLTVMGSGDSGATESEVEVTLAEHPQRDGAAYLGVALGGTFRMQRGIMPEGRVPGFDFTMPFGQPFESAPDFTPPAAGQQSL